MELGIETDIVVAQNNGQITKYTYEEAAELFKFLSDLFFYSGTFENHDLVREIEDYILAKRGYQKKGPGGV
jgi:hypothetical protein